MRLSKYIQKPPSIILRMNENYECQCFKKPLKSCNKFINNKKNYIKNKAYSIKGSINKEDELVYCASGIFILRKNKSIDE